MDMRQRGGYGCSPGDHSRVLPRTHPGAHNPAHDHDRDFRKDNNTRFDHHRGPGHHPKPGADPGSEPEPRAEPSADAAPSAYHDAYYDHDDEGPAAALHLQWRLRERSETDDCGVRDEHPILDACSGSGSVWLLRFLPVWLQSLGPSRVCRRVFFPWSSATDCHDFAESQAPRGGPEIHRLLLFGEKQQQS
mmetsp:Transcript_105648/g.215431  ORF Transcript_105648/g.215431 Transcript_105648/m.215431 type:complete len:191 (-) Transcript_105648:787-1359(-)